MIGTIMRDIFRAIAGGVAIAMTAVAALSGLAYGSISASQLTGPASAGQPAAAMPVINFHPVKAAAKILSTTPVLVGKPALATMARTYRVRAGDFLSTIAAREYGKAADWTVIYWSNRTQIRYANLIYIGQNFRIPILPGKIPAAPSVMSPAPAPVPVQVTVTHTSQGDSDDSGGASDHVSAPASNSGSYGNVNAGNYSGFQACVIARESGGNSQVMNSTGHYGLYQFSLSTWIEGGGSSGTFGHASVAEQNAVFWSIMNNPASGGANNWAPYDGC